MKIMDAIRKHILYRNIPEVNTDSQVHEIKNKMTKDILETHNNMTKASQRIEKSKTFYIARGMGVIPNDS